jgi:hypothetical protein
MDAKTALEIERGSEMKMVVTERRKGQGGGQKGSREPALRN